MMKTTINEQRIKNLLDRSAATEEDKNTIVSLFESVSYNIDEFLRTNYLDVIKDEDLIYNIIDFCFLEKECMDGNYYVYVFLDTNSVILQGRRECQAYRLDGSRIPLPENVYLYANCAEWGCIMKYEDLTTKAELGIKVNIDGTREITAINAKYGIMTTDGRILIPAICDAIEMKNYLGINMVINDSLPFWGKLWAKDESGYWPIRIEYDDKTYLGLNWSYESLLQPNEHRTIKGLLATLKTFLTETSNIYVDSVEEVVDMMMHNIMLLIEGVGYVDSKDMLKEDMDIDQLKDELQCLFSKYQKKI